MFDSVTKSLLSAVTLLILWMQVAGPLIAQETVSDDREADTETKGPVDPREFSPYFKGQWIGQGISYGPYREGESPGGLQPTREELTEDLNLISQHWRIIRLYGSSEVAEDVLDIIQVSELPIRVMLGAWITREAESDKVTPALSKSAKISNRKEVMEAIRLANSYPDEVLAVSVGNETQVYWSDHLTETQLLVRYIKTVRDATFVPVTTADDFNFWNKPESKPVANEVDFIVTHIHPMWAGLEAPNAMQWTERIFGEISEYHPDKTIVIGEAGWATQVHTEGEQAKLIKGTAGEKQQQHYYQQFTDWAGAKKVCTFFFEAFDEPWKGGPHPNEVEKHWGLFHVNRKPKAALSPISISQ